MKIISLKKLTKPVSGCHVPNLVTRALIKDIDTFKATARQFLRNNNNYLPLTTGLYA